MEQNSLLNKVFEAFANSSKSRYAFLCDMKTDTSLWSESCVEEFGLPSVEMKGAGQLWEEHIHPMDRERYHGSIEDLFVGRSDRHDMVYRAKNKHGNYVACTCTGSVIRDEDGAPLYFVGTIDNHGIASDYDPVTALLTKEKLLETIENNNKAGERYYILFVSSYNFMDLINIYGYEFGNKVLRKVSDNLLNYIADCDVFYVGGTIFALVSSKYKLLSDMRRLYDQIVHYARHGIMIDDVGVTLMLGGSCTEVNDFTVDIHAVFSNAIKGLNDSMTERHGELIIFNNESSNEPHEKIVTINAIRNSINNGCDGFYLNFQPVYEADSGKILGAESLIRWRKDPIGIVPPSEFINWLEDDPIFYELGLWIARTAMREWKEKVLPKHPELVLSINLSYTQLERIDFRKQLIAIVMELEFPANNLMIELTERCRLLDKTFLRDEIVAFRASGIRTVIDDFGTGFSALELLLYLPVFGIKMDKSFVTDIESDEKKQIVAKSIIKCATDIGITVTVEGIENEEMEKIVVEYGASHIQGFLHSKPMNMDEFSAFIG